MVEGNLEAAVNYVMDNVFDEWLRHNLINLKNSPSRTVGTQRAQRYTKVNKFIYY